MSYTVAKRRGCWSLLDANVWFQRSAQDLSSYFILAGQFAAGFRPKVFGSPETCLYTEAGIVALNTVKNEGIDHIILVII